MQTLYHIFQYNDKYTMRSHFEISFTCITIRDRCKVRVTGEKSGEALAWYVNATSADPVINQTNVGNDMSNSFIELIVDMTLASKIAVYYNLPPVLSQNRCLPEE